MPLVARPNTQGVDDLTDEQVRQGIAKMKPNKACGPDGIPIEVFQNCPVCMQILILLIKKIWSTEEVPADFVQATFVMLFKNKGSKDDPTKYRCLAMLNHAYKALSQCLLARIQAETNQYLSEWQAGFRAKRGCRDNVLTLRSIYDYVLAARRGLCVTFIDYSAAFDTVSHKFLEKALHRAGASAKTRALFKAIYSKANARTAVSDIDGGTVFSNSFQIRRGVVQGDITSPVYFILALELILAMHDRHQSKGVDFNQIRVHTLGYADDAALLDYDDCVASQRVTDIAQGSEADADMQISVAKTKTMHVCAQGEVSKTTNAEAEEVCKHQCPHIGCHKVFFNKRGMRIHAGKCKWKDEYLIDGILDSRGPANSSRQQFLIKWKGYGEEHDSWQPRGNIDPDYVKEYLQANGQYDYSWPGPRCPCCDLPCKSEHGLRMHLKSCRYVEEQQHFTDTLADRKVKRNKVEAAQANKPTVRCDGKKLENVFLFKYLGSTFTADGSHERDVEKRCAMALTRCGELRAVFSADHIPLRLKLKIYKTAVVSLMTYGSEAWRLDEKTIAKLNGCNAMCLSHITGKSAHAEASARTRTYDLVADIRKRRHKWLGHILRLSGQRYVKEAVKAQMHLDLPGNITMDAPPGLTFDDLTKLAKNRKAWRESVHWQSADTSFSLHAPCSVKFIEEKKTEAEKLAEKKAWDEVFRDSEPGRKPKRTRRMRKKAQRRRRRRKQQKQKQRQKRLEARTDGERADWARDYFRKNHATCQIFFDNTSTTTITDTPTTSPTPEANGWSATCVKTPPPLLIASTTMPPLIPATTTPPPLLPTPTIPPPLLPTTNANLSPPTPTPLLPPRPKLHLTTPSNNRGRQMRQLRLQRRQKFKRRQQPTNATATAQPLIAPTPPMANAARPPRLSPAPEQRARQMMALRMLGRQRLQSQQQRQRLTARRKSLATTSTTPQQQKWIATTETSAASSLPLTSPLTTTTTTTLWNMQALPPPSMIRPYRPNILATTWTTPAKQLFDPSTDSASLSSSNSSMTLWAEPAIVPSDLSCSYDCASPSNNNINATLWAAPAIVPSYVFAETISTDSPSTTSDTTNTTDHNLTWTPRAEIPPSNCSPTLTATRDREPEPCHYTNPILGHHIHNPYITHTLSPLITFPPLSPITPSHPPNANVTFRHTPLPIHHQHY